MIPNDCDNCPHLRFCVVMDITPIDCERLDVNDFDFEESALKLLKSLEQDEEWEIAEHIYTDSLLDYGDMENEEE